MKFIFPIVLLLCALPVLASSAIPVWLDKSESDWILAWERNAGDSSTWRIEVSSDLNRWHHNEDGFNIEWSSPEITTDLGNGREQASVTLNPPAGENRFYVRAVREPPIGTLSWSNGWQATNLTGSYVSLVDEPGGGFTYWRTYYWSTEQVDILTRRDLASLEEVIGAPDPSPNPAVIVMDSRIETDTPPAEGRNGPILSRMWVDWFAGTGYVAVGATAPDYQGGSLDLLARIFVSPDGTANSWTNLGPPAGEPAQWIADQKALGNKVRTDGGSLFQLGDGRWRLYLNGFGRTLCAMEADQLEGPWTFLRDTSGNIRELLGDLPSAQSRGGWIFPTVTRLPSGTFIAFVSDQWYPTAIWAAVAHDGVNFRHLGNGPTIQRADIPEAVDGLKNIRIRVNPATGQLTGMLALWDAVAGTWRIHLADGSYTPGPE